MTQMKIQRTQRGAAAARAAASQAGKGRFSGPGIMSNKIWLGVVMILLISGMALQAFAVVAPSWLRVRCQRGSLTVGLWTMCGDPLSNITWPRVTEKTAFTQQGNSTTPTKLESMKRSIGIDGQVGLSGANGEERVKVNTTKWLLFWDNCLEMVPDDDHPHPVWFQATQLLETMGLGCTGITTLLLTLYACAPTFMALQVALGFAAASFTAGGFIIVGMFNISGGKFDVGAMLPPDVTCNIETSSLYYSFKLASVSVSLLGVAGAVATLASILEKGDAHQNRINRKGEEPSHDTGNPPSPPGSPTPPSTISENESTPMSFDSIYESDYTYPYDSKSALRKKVSFQNREQLAAAAAVAAQHNANPGNSIVENTNTIPKPYNIPQSISAPHIYKPIPRRLSVQSIPNHQENIQMRRQSSPLRIYQPLSTQGFNQPLTFRQDSISSRGSNMSSWSRESQDRTGRLVNPRNSSRNSTRHYDNPSHRSSRT